MNDICPIGKYSNSKDLFVLDTETRRQHIYCIGKTGVGKTTLMETMIASDIKAGRGFCVIDPHGTLARKVADAVGKRVQDVIFIDVMGDHNPSYNPFHEDIEPASLADNIAMALEHVFPESWGPRMDDCLKNTIRLLIDNNLSFADIPRVLNDDRFRSGLLSKDIGVSDYWHDEYSTYDDKYREQVISPILNKVRPFSTNPRLRRLVTGKNSLNIPDVMARRKILILSLSKRFGAKSSKLIGSLIVSRFLQAALERDTVPQEQMPDFGLYIDEFQNFTSPAMAEILAEARKYRLNLALFHQYREQIEDKNLREATLASASTLIAFRVAVPDAERLAKELGGLDYGGVTPKELLDLPNYQAFVKTMNGNTPTAGIRIDTIPDTLGKGAFKKVLRNMKSRY